jgi:ABC-2 type transport system permease protein
MNWLRILIVGGIASYRALFDWLSPWILIPSFVVSPLAQILLFTYVGRSAGVADDGFFVVGNALQYSVIPCLFGMNNTFSGERLHGTLAVILASPASRLALVVGRSLPVLVNGFVVSLFALVTGSIAVGVELRPARLAPIALAILVTVASGVGLGLINAAFGLRFHDLAVLPNLLFGLLLLFSGANIPRAALPSWMAAAGRWLPMTHGIEAARRLGAGADVRQVARGLAVELALAAGYGIVGVFLLRLLERSSRRAATLELS